MADSYPKGLNVFKEMLPGLIPDGATSLRDGGVADELGDWPSITFSAPYGPGPVWIVAPAAW